ncbi:MAG: hypothetical protein LBI17_01700 [Rickettsiales bacterium]|jgi:hypothetical protein|nr:hypothetical protein [Rickettsiales bacterium]
MKKEKTMKKIVLLAFIFAAGAAGAQSFVDSLPPIVKDCVLEKQSLIVKNCGKSESCKKNMTEDFLAIITNHCVENAEKSALKKRI